MSKKLLDVHSLQDFLLWLDAQGIHHRDGKGGYQVAQVEVPDVGWKVIYKSGGPITHYTVDEMLFPLVEQFLSAPDSYEDYGLLLGANARLLAAAPDLLYHLEIIIRKLEESGHLNLVFHCGKPLGKSGLGEAVTQALHTMALIEGEPK